MDVTLGNALEMALSAGMIGEEPGCYPALNTRLREAVKFEKVELAREAPAEASGADCRFHAGVAARPSSGLTPCGASAPETAPARRQARESLRHILVVIDGCAASKAANGGVTPRRAAHLSIVAIDGERVHSTSPP